MNLRVVHTIPQVPAHSCGGRGNRFVPSSDIGYLYPNRNEVADFLDMMSSGDALPRFVAEHHAKPIDLDLSSWASSNPLPVLCEQKYDGVRVFLFKSGEKLVVAGKNGAVYTPEVNPTSVFAKVPELTHAPHRLILDGEYVARDGLHMFDVIQVDDRDVRIQLLKERKEILHEILDGTGLETPTILAKSISDVENFRSKVISGGGEGIIVKNPQSSYGQTGAWLRLKRFDTIDCFVIELFEKSEKAPRSWSLGVYDDSGHIVDVGKVSSFVEKVDPRQVDVGSVVEVRFGELVDGKSLGAPFIVRVRHDKTGRECLFSQITSISANAVSKESSKIGK